MATKKPEPDYTRTTTPQPHASTIVRRPRSELLERPDREALRRSAAAEPEPPVRLSAALLLRKGTELLILSAFIGTVLAYTFQVPTPWMERLYGAAVQLNDGVQPTGRWNLGSAPVVEGEPGREVARDRFFAGLLWDFEPLLSNGLPVLETKTTVWLLFALMAVFCHALARLYESICKRQVFPPDRRSKRWKWRRGLPVICIPAFLGWSALSLSPLGWGPEPPVDATPFGNAVGPAGGYHSIVALLQVAIALVFFLTVEDVLRTRRFVYKIIGAFLGLGVFSALVAILVHGGAPFLSTIWIKWGEGAYRNDVAGLIGHNTAMASFLVAPILIGLAGFVSLRKRMPVGWRVLCGAAIAVMVLVVLMAQSRAVVPILVVATVALAFSLARRAGVRYSIGSVVGVSLILGGLVLTQFVPHPANPLYRRAMPPAERLQHMSFERLKTETRLRILVCSVPQVLSAPLHGAGWGSFQYVYPEVQGRYYRENPRSRIAPTSRRTMRAHNEYLQTAFEVGAVGLGIGLAGLIAVLASGWRSLRGSINQRHTALQIGIWLAILALLVHAGVDFPLRVAPLACSLVLLLAVWSAGDRLWVAPTPPLDERPARRLPAAERPSRAELPRVRRGAAAMVVAIGIAFAGVYTAAGARALDWYTSASLLQSGINATNTFRLNYDSPAGPEMLNQAARRLNLANRLSPLNGHVLYQRANASMLAGNALSGEIRRLEREAGPDDPRTRGMRDAAISELVGAVDDIALALNEFRFHGVYRDRGQVHYLLSTLGRTPAERGTFYQVAVRDMQQAVDMNPGDPSALSTLLDWRERMGAPGTELLELRQKFYHFHPGIFTRRVMDRVVDLRTTQEVERAYEAMADAYPVDTQNPDFRAVAATMALYANRLGRARAIIGGSFDNLPDYADPLAIEFAVAEGQYRRALEMLRRLDRRMGEDARLYLRVLELALESQLSDSSGTRDARQRIDALAQRNPIAHSHHAQFLHYLLANTPEAYAAMQRRIALQEAEPLSTSEASLAAWLAIHRATRNRANFESLASSAREREPGTIRLAERDRAFLGEARSWFRVAEEAAYTDGQRRILRERLAQLDQVLGPE